MTDRNADGSGRPEPTGAVGNYETLRQFLDFHRATLAWKCAGLDDAQLRTRLGPSRLTLAGLIAHVATVEDHWFSTVVAERPFPGHAYPDGTPDATWEWNKGSLLPAAELLALWRGAVDRSNKVLAATVTDDEEAALAAKHPVSPGHPDVNLRWVMAHMIEEYARHNGHADFLREAIDGQTGE